MSYPGRSSSATWRASAEARIEKHRKSDLILRITSRNGIPLSGVKLHIVQTAHDFRFGAYIGHKFLNRHDGSTDYIKIQEKFFELFNYCTLPIYWHDWGWQSKWTKQYYIDCMKFMKQHGIRWRGHTLVYPAEIHMPSYMKNNYEGRPRALRSEVLRHVKEICEEIGKYAGGFCEAVDTVNEPRGPGRYLFEKLADGELEGDIYKEAKKSLPGVKLFVNDWGVLDRGGINMHDEMDYYHLWMQGMKSKGIPVEGIGFQGHFKELTHPQRIVEILNEFGVYGNEIHITEFDFDTNDENLLADYLEDVLTAAFSSPAVTAFVYWGFWEGDHWKPNAAMFRNDWSPKKNYYAWKKRIFHDWWSDLWAVTNREGSAVVRGFKGQYNVTIEIDGRKFEKSISLINPRDYVEIKIDVST